MDVLIDLSWRLYPATALMALGVAVVVSGLRRSFLGDSVKLLTWLGGLRLSVIGFAVAGIGAAWAWHQLWFLVLSLVIGGEELLESSIAIFVLKKGRRSPANQTKNNPSAN
ncbi:MAG: hypothetical protein ACE5KO_03400 [Candidatus Bathyarchaeia archaeon]